VTEEDLVFMLRLAHRHDQLPREARLMMESVLRFQRAVAREVMVPRPLVATVEVSWSEEELRQAVASSPHSRFPVVDGSPDRLVGVFHTKQLMRLAPGQHWTDAVVDPVFIPEGKPLTDLIEDFRTTGQHLAIVLDEFGGLSGVVSMEDVLELLVGEIADEFDLAGVGVVEADGGWSVPGHLSLRRLELFAHRELASPDEAESVGGLVSCLVAEAAVGAVVEWDGLSLEVLEVDGGRPTRVGVRRLPAPAAGTAQAP
jgi:CBS domain containing-hemolysin-like protein